MFGELPNLFKSEQSNPMTRRILLEKLNDASLGKEELTTLKQLIDTEKSNLFDVLEYVFNSDIKSMTRVKRVVAAQATTFAFFCAKISLKVGIVVLF